jgi:hypothetical protein
VTTGSSSSNPAIEVITGFSGSRAADNSKPANEVITGFLPEVTSQEQGGKRPSGASEPYREMTELELSRAATRWVSGRIRWISTGLRAATDYVQLAGSGAHVWG